MTKSRNNAATSRSVYSAVEELDSAILESSKLERQLHREKVESTVTKTIQEFLLSLEGSKEKRVDLSSVPLNRYIADIGDIVGNPNLNILAIRYARLDSISPQYEDVALKSLKPKRRTDVVREIVDAMLSEHGSEIGTKLKEAELVDLVTKIDFSCEDDRRYKNKILQHTYCVRSVNKFAKDKLYPHYSNAMFPKNHEDVVKLIDKIADAYRKRGIKSVGARKLPDSIVERHLKNWKPFAAKNWIGDAQYPGTPTPLSPYSVEIERYLQGAKGQLAFYLDKGIVGMPVGREPRGPSRDFRPDFLSTGGVMAEFKSLPKHGLVAFIALPPTHNRTKALAQLLARHQNQLGLPEIQASVMKDFDRAIEIRSMRATESESARLVEFITEFCEELKP